MNQQPRLTARRLIRRTGSEGPRHDPYAFTEMTVHERFADGTRRDVTLHLGLALWIRVNGQPVGDAAYDEQAPSTFYNLTGFSIDEFEDAYDRAHPHYIFDDPMAGLEP